MILIGFINDVNGIGTENIVKKIASTAAIQETLLRELLAEAKLQNKMTWACMTVEQQEIYRTLV